VPDNPKHFDHKPSRIERLVSKKGLRRLWLVWLIIIAVFQVVMFLRLRRQRMTFFHTTLEMILVFALVIVVLIGAVVKNRQNRRS
jgi:cytochrome bd-type quinol oxidase subunit 2